MMTFGNNLELWRISVDVCLMLSMLYLSVRILYSPERAKNLTRLNELNGSMEVLIKDAEEAGRDLNEHLIKRQSHLERLLSDLYTAEKNLKVLSAEGEDLKFVFEKSEKRINEKITSLNTLVEIIEKKVQEWEQSYSKAAIQERNLYSDEDHRERGGRKEQRNSTKETLHSGRDEKSIHLETTKDVEHKVQRGSPFNSLLKNLHRELEADGEVSQHQAPFKKEYLKSFDNDLKNFSGNTLAERTSIPNNNLFKTLELGEEKSVLEKSIQREKNTERILNRSEERVSDPFRKMPKKEESLSLELEKEVFAGGTSNAQSIDIAETQGGSKMSALDPRLGVLSPVKRQVQTL
jgi:hypothetical protein